MTTPHKDNGLQARYSVSRLDGSSEPGQKHEHCDYYVLDWQHDPFVIPAMRAYADACETLFPNLAKDIRKRIIAAETKFVLNAAGK